MRGLRNESKIEVKGILITRKNGSTKCPYNIVVVTWEESDAIFKLWAKGATGNGGFETCDFRVVFEDGFSYSGTFYLKQQDVFGRNLLPKHIRNICDETRIGWDADSFLNSYSIPATA